MTKKEEKNEFHVPTSPPQGNRRKANHASLLENIFVSPVFSTFHSICRLSAHIFILIMHNATICIYLITFILHIPTYHQRIPRHFSHHKSFPTAQSLYNARRAGITSAIVLAVCVPIGICLFCLLVRLRQRGFEMGRQKGGGGGFYGRNDVDSSKFNKGPVSGGVSNGAGGGNTLAKANTYEDYGDREHAKSSPAHSSPTANRTNENMI